MKHLKIFIVFCSLILLVFNLNEPQAAKRTALVIGNSNYASSPLANPVNDAADMDRVLKQLGFSVILKTDAGRREMMDALNEFGRNLVRSEIGILYFAGHGMQIDNTNYLIPVDARVESESDVLYEGVYTGSLLKNLIDPGLTVQELFNQSGLDVMNQTAQKQVPWISSTSVPRFYLAGGNPEDLYLKPADPKAPPETAASQASSPRAGDVWKEPVTGMAFVWVPGGCFMMGQTDSEKQDLIKDAGLEFYVAYIKRDLPRHEICVDGFWMGKTEVTLGQFRQFIRSEGYKTDADKKGTALIKNKETEWKWKDLSGYWEKVGYSQTDSHPVVNVSWNDAKAFIKWLSAETGQRFGLPSEAQWEYAARGGTTGKRFWGGNDAEACKYANMADKGNNWEDFIPCGYKFTAPVANYSPNPFGLYDMLGNVWEWCEDVFDSNAYSKHARNNPVVTSGGTASVCSWGSFPIIPRRVRAADADRNRYAPDLRYRRLGFRLSLPQIRQE